MIIMIITLKIHLSYVLSNEILIVYVYVPIFPDEELGFALSIITALNTHYYCHNSSLPLQLLLGIH